MARIRISRAGRAQGTAGRAPGYTLLELLVVMAILSLAAGIVVGFLPNTRSTANLTLEAGKLEAGLRAAQSAAIEKNIDVAFQLDVATGRWSYRSGMDQRIANGIRLAIYTGRDLVSDQSSGAIEFFPNGQSSGGHILLQAGEASERLDVDWLTGRIHRHSGNQ